MNFKEITAKLFNMTRYKYQLPSSWNAYDIYANNEKEALRAIRKTWDLTYYMLKKVEVWEATMTVDQEIAEKREHLKDVLKANPHLCLTDF